MIDTHSHIGEDIYRNDLDNLMKTFASEGLQKVFCVGYNMPMNLRCIELAEKYDNIYAIIGIHPSEANSWNDETKASIIACCKNNKVLAIGEIGLDYHFDDAPTRDIQKQVFIEQILIADELRLPIVIHVRDAVGDLIDILKAIVYGVVLRVGPIDDPLVRMNRPS